MESRADQVIVRGENFTNAKVINLSNGLLRFRGHDGLFRSEYLDDVDLLIVEGGGFFDDLNEAERFLSAGQPAKAAIRYRRALQLSTGFWSDLISVRLLVAHDRAKEVDKAVQSLIRVTRSKWAGPVSGARLIPVHLPEKRNGASARAVRELDRALAARQPEAHAVIFETARYKLLHQMRDQLAPGAAARVVAHEIPEEVRSDRVYDVLASAMRTTLLAGAVSEDMLAGVDRAIAHCPQRQLADFLLLKGQMLSRKAVTREDLMRASWPFLRVAIQMENDPRAGRGLLGAVRILERLEDSTGARTLLNECIASKHVEAATRDQAKAMLDALDVAEKSNVP